MGENIVITIARQYGSGGKTIGAMLAKELGINCYSREILKMASEESGINEGLFGMSDEKIKKAPWFKILNRPYDGELLTPEDRDFVSDDNLFNYQAKVIRDLAEKESCVIVGRCADYILDQEAYPTLNVFIHADMPHRISRVLERYGDTEVDVRKRLERKDRNRKTYYRYYTDREWGKYTNYQINLDSGYLGVDQCVRIIVDTVRAMDRGNDTAEQKTDEKNKA